MSHAAHPTPDASAAFPLEEGGGRRWERGEGEGGHARERGEEEKRL